MELAQKKKGGVMIEAHPPNVSEGTNGLIVFRQLNPASLKHCPLSINR